MEAAGVREEAQGVLQQVLVQRVAGRQAFTAEQQQVAALLNMLSRHATAGCWCGGIGTACEASAALACGQAGYRLVCVMTHDASSWSIVD